MQETAAFLADNPQCISVEISSATGSTPRSAGTRMLVSQKGISGTIGGGQLEYMAIDEARRMLDRNQTKLSKKVALGPELGQCCGGKVELKFKKLNEADTQSILNEQAAMMDKMPHIYLFGAGHVGTALAKSLSLLPVKTHVVETRKAELEKLQNALQENERLEFLLTALPEQVIKNAPKGSAYVIFTHDHALDYLLTAAALLKPDAGFAGMIGSKTKRTLFERYFIEEGGERSRLEKLFCPIGGTSSDKRPEVIAALTTSQILKAIEANQTVDT